MWKTIYSVSYPQPFLVLAVLTKNSSNSILKLWHLWYDKKLSHILIQQYGKRMWTISTKGKRNISLFYVYFIFTIILFAKNWQFLQTPNKVRRFTTKMDPHTSALPHSSSIWTSIAYFYLALSPFQILACVVPFGL